MTVDVRFIAHCTGCECKSTKVSKAVGNSIMSEGDISSFFTTKGMRIGVLGIATVTINWEVRDVQIALWTQCIPKLLGQEGGVIVC